MMKLIFLSCLSISLFGAGLFIQSKTFAETPTTTQNNDSLLSMSAQSTSSVSAAQYLLQASALLFEQKNFTASKNILNAIDTSSLTPEMEQRYVLQQAALAIASNDSAKATVWLNDSIIADIPENDVKKQIALHELRAKTFLLKKQFIDSAKEYFLLVTISPKINNGVYVDSLWDVLSKTDVDVLTNARLKTPSGDFYNWIELALITKEPSLDKNKQQEAINKWFTMHANHPKPSALLTSKQPMP